MLRWDLEKMRPQWPRSTSSLAIMSKPKSATRLTINRCQLFSRFSHRRVMILTIQKLSTLGWKRSILSMAIPMKDLEGNQMPASRKKMVSTCRASKTEPKTASIDLQYPQLASISTTSRWKCWAQITSRTLPRPYPLIAASRIKELVLTTLIIQ